MDELNNSKNSDIGRHLGKSSSYADRYDPTLLVAIPRSLNRRAMGLADTLPFEGCDIWNAYEVSCLTESGLPLTAVLRFKYPANSEFLVESKSLKLYLNSFNQEKLGFDRNAAIKALMQTIREDLQKILGCPPELIEPDTIRPDKHPLQAYPVLEEQHPYLEITNYMADAKVLESSPSTGTQFEARSRVLRSRCRQTSQPDWGEVYIQLDGPRHPTTDSLLRYLVSFRLENHFHEEIVESIFADLLRRFGPSSLMVLAQYTRRGGIDINPLRTTPNHPLAKRLSLLSNFAPTDRQ